jgi:hypothetical protein
MTPTGLIGWNDFIASKPWAPNYESWTLIEQLTYENARLAAAWAKGQGLLLDLWALADQQPPQALVQALKHQSQWYVPMGGSAFSPKLSFLPPSLTRDNNLC